MVFRSSQLAEVGYLVSHSVYYNPHPAKVDRGELEYSDLSPLASMNDERSVHCELRGFESAARRGGERKKKGDESPRVSASHCHVEVRLSPNSQVRQLRHAPLRCSPLPFIPSRAVRVDSSSRPHAQRYQLASHRA